MALGTDLQLAGAFTLGLHGSIGGTYLMTVLAVGMGWELPLLIVLDDFT